MWHFSHRHIRTITIVLLALFFLAAYCGIVVIDAKMSNDGVAMGGCPLLQNMDVVCNTDPLAHVAAWQSTFMAPPMLRDSALLFLASLMLALGALHWRRLTAAAHASCGTLVAAAHLTYRRHAPVVCLLYALFARGIPNPKVF